MSVAEGLKTVKTSIQSALADTGRDSDSVTLVAASKSQPVEKIRQAYLAGQKQFGENYCQEALKKIEMLADLPLQWHFIGPIQTNKTRKIAENFSWVQSVQREKEAKRLNEQRPEHLEPLNICVQVNVSSELNKNGCRLDEIDGLLHAVAKLTHLRLRGLMVLPHKLESYQDQLKHYQQIYALYLQLQQRYDTINTLSMGMSQDMVPAIIAGSTMVRVGTAIFGKRNP